MTSIPDPLPAEGHLIPLRAAFMSLKGMPSIFALGHNNISAALRLFPDHLELVSVKKVTYLWEDLAEVSAFRSLGTRNLQFKPAKGLMVQTANVTEDADFLAVLSFLQGKGVKLSPKAEKFLAKAG